MQRILNILKKNAYLSTVLLLITITAIFVLASAALRPGSNTETQSRTNRSIDVSDLPEGSPIRNYLIDRAAAEEIEGDEAENNSVNLSFLLPNLPIKSSGYQIAFEKSQIVITYQNENNLNGAFSYLKQFNIYPDYPGLKLVKQ